MPERTPADVLGMVKDEGVEIIDFRFCDLPGLMQHFSVPAHEFSEDAFEEGYGFDGSSIRGFQEIQESDMILLPDPDTAVIDPFRVHKTLNINCFVKDPVTGESYEYQVLGPQTYAVCARFERADPDSSYPESESGTEDAWRHGADRHCFQREAPSKTRP